MHSIDTEDLIKGHLNIDSAGPSEEGTVPLTEAEMRQLLRRLCSCLPKASQSERSLSLRGGLTCSLLWRFGYRGFNDGSIRTIALGPP